MSRRKDVFNSPEYRHIEENLDDILKELEGDEETRNMTMPEEWDKDFREILEKVNEENRQRHRKKLRRTIAAAAAVLIVSVPLIGLVGTETVEGDGILELIEKNIFMNNRRYDMTGTEDGELTIDLQELNEVTFSASTMQELNEEIDEEITHPFYRMNWIPEGFSIQEAVYNKKFESLNIDLSEGASYIYISQQFIVDTAIQNSATERKKIGIVKNRNIGIDIDIYNSITDGYLYFSLSYDNARLDCYMNTSIENCELIAANLEFK